MPPVLISVGTAFVLSVALTALARLVAWRLGFLDVPREDRWHRRPVPRVGGVAMCAAFFATMAACLRPPLDGPVLGALAGAAAIFLIGLTDDLRRLENRPKLVLLIAAASVPVLFGVRFAALPAVAAAPLTGLWVLGAANAMNWLDNMDGLAAGVGAIAAATLLALAMPAGPASPPAIMAAALLGVSLGFLVHNFPPARVFMGDAGSGFLGVTLAAAATLGSSQNVAHVLASLLAPGLVLAVPIFDSLMVTWQRVVHRRPIFQGGRDHPSHRLVRMGLSERRAVVLLYALSALSGAAAVAAARLGIAAGLVVASVVALGFAAVGAVLAEVRVYEDAPSGATAASGTRLPPAVTNKRWLVSMALDLVLLQVAFVGAHLLRFEGELPAQVADRVTDVLPAVAAVKMAVLFAWGVYRGHWRYAGLIDLIRLAQAATVASGAATLGLFAWTGLVGLSRAALVMDWVLTVGLLASARVGLRAVREYLLAGRHQGRRVLVAGAGAGGARLVAALRDLPDWGYLPVGFIAEGPAARGAVLQGLPVVGDLTGLPALLRARPVDAVIVVPEDLNGADEAVRRICDEVGVPVLVAGRLLETPPSVDG
ncbi:MAG: hypothetical protein QN131_15000 [Armatimonadota bacterium]|nr:hypothetical protein [Armatimonadota bacterium]